MSITVTLVDDHTLVRQAVARLIEDEPGLMVAGQAGSAAEALALLEQGLPDVVVVDVSLPDGDGLSLVTALRSRSDQLGIVVLTMHSDDHTLVAALEAGASGLVVKTAPSEAVITAIRRAAETPSTFSADGLATALRRHGSGPQLTRRELDVLELLARGLAVSVVAKQLYLSESTVKTHIKRIYDKLGARTRAGAVMAAVRIGLVRPEDVHR